MPKTKVRRALPVLAAALAVLCAGNAATAAPRSVGPAATSTGWRITKVLTNRTIGGLWAGGPRDAWLAGDACAEPACGTGTSATINDTMVARHWDGTAWRQVVAPKAYVNTPLDQGVGAVAATSAHDAWVFAYRGKQDLDHTDALHWTGKRWGKPVLMNAEVEAAVAASPTQVWAFGAHSGTQAGYIAHFNGTTWKAGGFPIQGAAAASVSANDIWVGGVGAKGALAVEHWDGHAWRETTLVKAPSTPQGQTWLTGVTAIGPRQVWVSITIFSGSTLRGYLYRWNGTSWARIGVPYGSGTAVDTPVVSDGHGGIWGGITTGFSGSNERSWLAHVAGGRWTKTAIPNPANTALGETELDHLAWIPGTRSLWATGELSDGFETAVLKYGP